MTHRSPAATTTQMLPGVELLDKAGAENFPVALRILRREQREGLLAVYGYARLVDDVGDLAPGDRLAQLEWLEDDLQRAAGGAAQHPLVQRVAPLIGSGAPLDPFQRLIAANRQDQRVARYRTFDELVAYCHLSADPVGELVLHVFGAAGGERVAWSDAICTGLQLAEHWQDVGEDAARGRIYLPLDDLARFGVSEDEITAGGSPSPAFRELMGFEVDRARELLRLGLPLLASLRGRARLAVAGYAGGGLAALDAVERSGYDVLRRIPRASGRARLQAAVGLLRGAR